MAQQTKNPGDQKYSDERLDPFQTEADAIFNRPDMQALDDQLNSIDREHRAGKDDDEKQRQAQAEAEEVAAADNAFDYSKKNQQSKKADKKSSGARRFLNRKNAIRGGIAGGSIGLALSIFGFLTPFKIPALMQIITDETGQRVEQITTRRAKVILARAVLSRFGANGAVVTGKGPVSSLIATMRTQKFEDKLKKNLADKGIDYKTDGKTITLSRNGQDLGKFNSSTSEENFLKVINGDRVTNAVVTDFVKEQIPTWRFFKRAKFASWLRIKYGISRFGTKKTTETDKEKKIADVQEERLNNRYGQYADNLSEAVGCLMGEPGCPVQSKDRTVFEKLNEKVRTKASVVKEAIKSSVAEQTKLVTVAAGKSLVAKVNEQLEKLMIKKFATKAIPIIGWIDLAATLDHIAYTALENDYITTIPAYYRSISYAQMYGEWIGYGDQVKAGEMDSDVMALLASQMDGAEESQAFNYLSGNPEYGTPVKQRIDENSPSKIKQEWDYFKGTPGGIYYKYISHNVLELYYNTIGGNGLLGAIGDFFGGVIGSVVSYLTPDQLEEYMSKYIGEIMGKLFVIIGLSADPLDVGADLFNDQYAGGDVTFNKFMAEKGSDKLSDAEVAKQRGQIAYERAQQIKDKGFMYAMFSPDNTKSFTNQLAIALPTATTMTQLDVTNGVGKLASLITNAPSRLSAVLNPLTKADSGYVNLNGINNYGATEAHLSLPLADEAVTGDACPAVEDGVYNGCNWDKDTAEAMLCNFKPESEECNFTSSSLTGEGLGVMSYNILGAGHTNDGGIGYKDRLKSVVELVRQQSPDVIGFQEVNGAENAFQQNELQKDLGDTYDMYSNNGADSDRRPIYWKKNAFTEIDHGTYNIPRYTLSHDDQMPWVKLRSLNSDIIFYVFNQHNATGDSSHPRSTGNITSPEERKVAAERLLAAIKKVNTENLPVIMTGDYNSTCEKTGRDDGMSTDEIPCVMFQNNGFMDAGEEANKLGLAINHEYSTSHGEVGDIRDSGRIIDHVFYSQGLQVTGWQNIINDLTKSASDHTPVLAKIKFPGGDATGGAATASGFAWPLGEQNWKANESLYVRPHTSTGTAWGSDNMGTGNKGAGLAVDISAHSGTQVYAMYPGTVTSTNLCGANDGVAIKSTVNGKTFGIAYMHGTNKKVNVGDKVTAGQPIMQVGMIGCNATGPHLHIGMAYDGKYVCPQDVFVAMAAGGSVDLGSFTSKANYGCGGRSFK